MTILKSDKFRSLSKLIQLLVAGYQERVIRFNHMPTNQKSVEPVSKSWMRCIQYKQQYLQEHHGP